VNEAAQFVVTDGQATGFWAAFFKMVETKGGATIPFRQLRYPIRF